MLTASDRNAVILALSPGELDDGPEGRSLFKKLGSAKIPIKRLMDRAYEGDETRKLAEDLGYISVVPSKINRKNP